MKSLEQEINVQKWLKMIQKIQIHLKNTIMIWEIATKLIQEIFILAMEVPGWILLSMLYAGVLHRNGRTYKWNIELNLHLKARVG